MDSQEIVSIAIRAGHQVTEYDNHYCITKLLDVNVVVTVPKVSYIAAKLIKRIKTILGL